MRVEGGQEDHELGYSGQIGDISGDGCDDLVLGARGEAYGAVTGAGAVYVYLSGS
jgi:hypothetical protein